jgi:hypothetical protein
MSRGATEERIALYMDAFCPLDSCVVCVREVRG